MVVTGDVDTAVRQYMRKKPDEFYYNLNVDKSEAVAKSRTIQFADHGKSDASDPRAALTMNANSKTRLARRQRSLTLDKQA